MKLLFSLSFALLYIICVFPAKAQNNSTSIVHTGVPFLRISTDSRAQGMGSTGIAISPDGAALHYNIGKIPFIQSRGLISVNYSPWLTEWASGMYLASLHGAYRITDKEAIHGGVKYFNPGAVDFKDNAGNYLHSYHPKEFAVDLGYSKRLSNRTGLGIGLKYIHSDLAIGYQDGESFKPGNSVAADVGFYYQRQYEQASGWSFGMQLSNLGTKISYTESEMQRHFLPANLGIGTAYTRLLNEKSKVSFALDINKLLVPTAPADSLDYIKYQNRSVVRSWFTSFSDAPKFSEELKEFAISLGAEYSCSNLFAVRAGYHHEDETKGGRTYFSCGTSVSYRALALNFSYLVPTSASTNKNPLANSIQLGINIHFD